MTDINRMEVPLDDTLAEQRRRWAEYQSAQDAYRLNRVKPSEQPEASAHPPTVQGWWKLWFGG